MTLGPSGVRLAAGRLVFAAAAALMTVSCQREIVAPGQCPATCPGGQPELFDTVLVAAPDRDSSFSGYVLAGEGTALLVSDGLPEFDSRAVLRFLRRGDSIRVADTMRSYTIDSVGFSIGLLTRDTTLSGQSLRIHRLPLAVADSGVGFSQVAPFLDDSTLIGTMPIPDSVFSGPLRLIISGPQLPSVDIPPADSGVIAIAVALSGPTGTGLRIGSQSAGVLTPVFQSFVTIDDMVDSTLQEQVITRVAGFNTYVVNAPPALDSTQLIVGGAPSSRVLVRFDLPPFLQSTDSSQIVRATLELTPVSPASGIPGDTVSLRARGVITDLGAKSATCPFTPGNICGNAIITRLTSATVAPGDSLLVEIEVDDLVRGWQDEGGSEPAFFLSLDLEASSFTRPVFHSTRAASGVRPRLRITYGRAFEFENQ